jgi:hypothetical protein
MLGDIVPDEGLVQRLPLPLAQLYRGFFNAKSPLERHLTALGLWEVALKLLTTTAVMEFAEQPLADPLLDERLKNLARPSLGHWWEFVRLLVPALAERGDGEFQNIRNLLLDPAPRHDLPRAAGLAAVLDDAEGARAMPAPPSGSATCSTGW